MGRAKRALVAVVALAGLGGCKPLDDTMVAIFGRSMRDSRSFDPYENPMTPAANTVAFSAGNFPGTPDALNIGQPEGVDVPLFTQQDMVPIGIGNRIVSGMVNPVPPDDEAALARGEELFNRFCAVCHGPNGVGANAYIAQKHPTVAVYNLSGPVVQAYTDQYIYGMIRVGRGLMPEYGSRISHFDRWKIVNYVRLLQREAGSAAGQPEGEG